MQTLLLRVGIRKGNNSPVATRGLVTTTGLADLCHLLPPGRTAIIRKVHWYNNVGVNVTLAFGTVDNAVPAVPVQLLPDIVAINGLDGWYEETHLPDVEFIPDRAAGALGLAGDIYVVASAAGVLLRLTVEEFGV